MPFTLSHPALILPLNYISKKWISLTALVAGSMMPDFEAFMRMKSEKDQSHTWSAALWFGLPVGLALTFLFHCLVRDALINHLPVWLQRKFSYMKEFNWIKRFRQSWHIIIISFFIGIASHFFWDSFSHFDGWLMRLKPELTGNTTVFNYELEIPYLIQYINSLFGVLVIGSAVLMLPSDKKAAVNKNILWYWLLVMLFSVLTVLGRLYSNRNLAIDDYIVTSITAFCLAVTLVSLLYFFKNYFTKKAAAQH